MAYVIKQRSRCCGAFRPEDDRRPPRPPHGHEHCCPCGWRHRPEDCDRAYECCRRRCDQETCERCREDCERRWADWPFYTGPCPQPRRPSFCACTPVTAVHGLFTRDLPVTLAAGETIDFDGEYVENRFMRRRCRGIELLVAGTYLITLTVRLPAGTYDTRLAIRMGGEETVGGDVRVATSASPQTLTATTIATAEAGDIVDVATDNALAVSGMGRFATLTILRIE